MIKCTYNFIFLLFALITITSCNKENSDSYVMPPATNENNWKLNNYNFSRSTSFQNSTTYTNGNPFVQVIIDSKISNDNESFKSCNIVFWFNTNEEGTFVTKSTNTLVSFTTLKYINIKCTVSNASGAGAIYESSDTDNSITITKVNNKFVLHSPDPITLTKTLDDRLPNAPNTITFTCDKLR